MRAEDDASADPLHTYVFVRAVAPPDSPFAGRLARGASGRTVLLVDRDDLAGWTGWSAPPDDHLVAPIDVVRRLDGHDVVLPHLSERLDRFVQRRAASAPLASGEAVTAAVSVLRGLAAAVRHGSADGAAQWWLTDDARPVLVEGVGDASARRASADILSSLGREAGSQRSNDAIEDAAELARDERTRASQLDAAENDLFTLSTPEPLVTTVLAPRRGLTREPVAVEDAAEVAPRGLWHSVTRHVDAGLSDAVSDAVNAVVRRVRATGSRRRPIVVAAVLAVAVAAVGLGWPANEGDGASQVVVPAADATPAPAGSPPGSAVAPPESSAAPAASPPVGGESDTDPALALAALLDARRACLDDACRAGVQEDASRRLAPGAIDADAAVRSIRLVDDLGGLAVLRVERSDGEGTPQLVTVVEGESGWRVRDAYDAANPPG